MVLAKVYGEEGKAAAGRVLAEVGFVQHVAGDGDATLVNVNLQNAGNGGRVGVHMAYF